MRINTPTRRDFLKAMGMSMAAMTVSGLPNIGRVYPSNGNRPNVLFIAIDDLNDWIGCLGGHPNAKTPHLDQLAERGVLFTNAHCPAPICNPSRSALLTGIRPTTSGIVFNDQPFRESPVLKNAVTIPQHFMAHGYKAIGSGKIFHNPYPDPDSWNEYWPSKTQTTPWFPSPPWYELPLNGIPGAGSFDWGPVDAQDEEMGDWKVADWVISQLEKQHDRPFFLGCGFFRPHLPWYAPQKYFDLHPLGQIVLPNVKNDDLVDIPPAGRWYAKLDRHIIINIYGQWLKAVQGYLASISFVDACIGRVIDALDKSPYRDNTIIVLWSDNGHHLGEKLHWGKSTLWEESTQIVLMFAGPGCTASGGRCKAPVNLIDIYPTLIELCGLDTRWELEGRSLVPLLEKPSRKWERPSLTSLYYDQRALRTERWRYIRYAGGSEELYDHEDDPLEWKNLADDPAYSNIKEWLRQLPLDSPITRENYLPIVIR